MFSAVHPDYPDAPDDTPEWVFWLLDQFEYEARRIKATIEDASR